MNVNSNNTLISYDAMNFGGLKVELENLEKELVKSLEGSLEGKIEQTRELGKKIYSLMFIYLKPLSIPISQKAVTRMSVFALCIGNQRPVLIFNTKNTIISKYSPLLKKIQKLYEAHCRCVKFYQEIFWKNDISSLMDQFKSLDI